MIYNLAWRIYWGSSHNFSFLLFLIGTLMRSLLLASSAILTLSSLASAQSARDVIDGYADLAFVMYGDSLAGAVTLQSAIDTFVAAPGPATFDAAKSAWLASRVPYQQTEVYRFGNAYVDDWEGKVNAWPLDEGLIDYVDTSFYGSESEENDFFLANVVANADLMVAGQAIDASEITAGLLQSLHEVDGVEANVATGYHAVEFLLWGQDLNGSAPGAGARTYSDYLTGEACTNGNCDRRAAYLKAATDLLVADLEDIVAAWDAGGEARVALDEAADGEALSVILTGMGSLSYGELAGERMQLGLLLHDPEEEHDCFADNTHNSHFYDIIGIQNVYLGQYTATDGSQVTVPSLSSLVAAVDTQLDAEVQAKLSATVAAAGLLKVEADSGRQAYDQMIGADNPAGNALVQNTIDALIEQTRSIERVVASLDIASIEFEGSDSLDNPGAVFE